MTDPVTDHAPARPRFLDPGSPPRIGSLVAITGVAAMSMNIFLPSLAVMAEDLGADYAVMQLSVALYLGAVALSQPIIGPLADRYGRRPVMIGAYIVFCVASLGCALATSAPVFLACRMGQAMVYAGVVLSRTIVRDLMPASRAASTIGYVTMGMAMVPMVSPALGGALAAWFGWRSSFWVLLSFGLVALVLILRDVGETRPGGYDGFADQLRGSGELLRSPRFWGYALASAFAAGTFFTYLGGAPYVGGEIFGLSPGALGVLFGATSLGYALGSFLSGRLSSRAGLDRMVLAGSLTCCTAISLSLLVFLLGHGSPASFFGLMIFVGIGYGLVLPNATVGLLSVRPKLAGTASGLGGAIMIGGGAALSAFAGAIVVDPSGAERLLATQLAAALGALAAILYVRHRNRSIPIREN